MAPDKDVPGVQTNYDMPSLRNNGKCWEIIQAVNTTWQPTNLKTCSVNIHPIHAIKQTADLKPQLSW